MKLYEVENPVDNIVLLLRNLLSQANDQQQPSYLSWGALSNLPTNMDGQAVNYDTFKSSYDSNPELFKHLVKHYDARGVTLNTQVKKPQQGGQQDTVSKMAKSATARRRN
jgi:hypothetical protein